MEKELLTELFKLFKVDNEKDLIEARTKAGVAQTKLFASKKPETVKLSEASAKQLTEQAGVEFLPGYESRVLDYKITDETADRYGDIVRVKGVDLVNYRKNPVIQFAHDYQSTPVGATIKLTKTANSPSLNALGLFMDDRVDDTGVSSTVFKLAKSGFMKASSIGFRPIKANYPSDKEERNKLGLGAFGVEFLKTELLEWSPVPVPANPNAVQNYFKEVRAEELRDFEQRDIDIMQKYVLKDANILDIFVEHLKAKQGGGFPTISLPSFSKADHDDDEENPKKPKKKPKAKEGEEEENGKSSIKVEVKIDEEKLREFQDQLKEIVEEHGPDNDELKQEVLKLVKSFTSIEPQTIELKADPAPAPIININIDKSVFEQHNVLAKEIKESIDKMNGLFEKMFSATGKTSPNDGGDNPLPELKIKSLYEPSSQLIEDPSLS